MVMFMGVLVRVNRYGIANYITTFIVRSTRTETNVACTETFQLLNQSEL